MSGTTPNPYYHYQTQPVNFNEHDPFDFTNKSGPGDTATAYTGYTSGITVSNHDFVNSRGETQAQALAAEYRTLSSDAENSQTNQNNLATSVESGEQQYGALSTNDHLTYIDEDFNYYSTRKLKASLEPVASTHARADSSDSSQPRGFHDLAYEEPPVKESSFTRFMRSGRYPLEQRIEDKKRGIGRQKYPFVTWILTLAMLSIFIYELVKNNEFQGTPISMKPFPNYMLGPSQTALITFGARFPPCMKLVDAISPTSLLGCPSNLDNPPTITCTVEQVCAFGGFNGQPPNQWFRFITPVFLHAGIIHLALNLLAQWLLSAQVEREMGSSGFLILYFAAGIFGNVFGGNFSLVGAPSVGASGAIFGTVGVLWVDLVAHWQFEQRPVVKLVVLIVELIIGIGFGYIPGVDNFAHIGGFLMGLLCAIILYPIISTTRQHRVITWFSRIAAIPVAVMLFVFLVRNFYTGDPYAACSWCRYLSCIPTSSNNQCKGTGLST